MRRIRTATAALLGAAALLALSASPAPARDVDPAFVTPSEAAPGGTVTIGVACATSSARTVTVDSQALEGGSATLTVGPDGRYTGTARLATREESADRSAWGLSGRCPDGDTFTGSVTVQRHGRAPHGGVRTGLGGSVGTDTGQLATGGVLVAAGVGGFWLLRRRTTDDDRPL